MNRLLLKIAIIATAGSLLVSNSSFSQILPPAKKADHVKIIKGPELELALENFAILRWTSTNPGGDDEHFAIVHYGTDPRDLSQTAKSHIRLNRTHPETIFRVRMLGLKPQTTYYYWVTSAGADGTSDGVKSAVNQFTTPAPGQRIAASPTQPVPQSSNEFYRFRARQILMTNGQETLDVGVPWAIAACLARPNKKATSYREM